MLLRVISDFFQFYPLYFFFKKSMENFDKFLLVNSFEKWKILF